MRDPSQQTSPSNRRHLEVVTDRSAVTPFERRRRLAEVFAKLAEIARDGGGWTISGCDRDPIQAAIIVTFGPDGEPTPLVTGIDGDNWTDRDNWTELTEDAIRAIRDLRRARIIINGQAIEPEPTYEHTRNSWLRTVASRAHWKAKDAAERATHEAEYPWLCDCGQRLKSERGIPSHERGRPHQRWLQRKAEGKV